MAKVEHIRAEAGTEISTYIIEEYAIRDRHIFPEFFTSIFENGILRRALAEGLVTVGVHDLRAFTHDRHRTVDDRPFGGGEGMVLKPEPLAEALASLGIAPKAQQHASNAAQARLPHRRWFCSRRRGDPLPRRWRGSWPPPSAWC